MTALLIVLLTFDAAAAAKALSTPEGRPATLRGVLALDALELAEARKGPLAGPVAALVADTGGSFEERVLAVRVAALLGDAVAVEPLKALVGQADTPESVALAREAARALRQLKAIDALALGLNALDPEVRAMAAAAGAAPGHLCRILQNDAWPQVRAAAARGLGGHPRFAACLGDALSDPDGTVALAVAQAAGQVKLKVLRDPLRKLAGSAKARVPLRAAAFLALARFGDIQPARAALTTHLEKGGIVPLAEAAVRALAIANERELLRAALGSKTVQVRLLAARLLVEARDLQSVPAVEGLLGDLPPRQRASLEEALRALKGVPAEPDPADSDPE